MPFSRHRPICGSFVHEIHLSHTLIVLVILKSFELCGKFASVANHEKQSALYYDYGQG